MRSLSIALFLSLCTGGLFAAAQTHPDVSGRWELIVEKSSFGKMEKPVGMTLVSENKGDHLHSVITTQTSQGEQSTEGDWYPDGKARETQKPVPGYSTTHWDGNTLVNERKSKDGQYVEVIKLTVDSDGTHADEAIDTHSPNGNNKSKLRFKRH